MPPKRRKVHLAAARNSKTLKANNAANEAQFEVINNDNDELSDCHYSDDDWHDDEFENNLNPMSQTAFDVIIENAKKPTAFVNKRPLVYVGNSERTQRRKKSAAKIATTGVPELNAFFPTLRSYQQIPHQSAKELADKLKQLEKDQEQEGFELALVDINELIADKSLILQVKTRLQLMMQYINLRLNGLKCMNASKTLAISIGKGDNQARLIRSWTQNFINYRQIPVSMRGKHQKIKSLLGDEDIHQMISEYLWSIGCNVTVSGFKAYVEQEVFPSVGIESKKTISDNTARAWLKHFGWEFRVERKDVYYDGHERPDVIEYRRDFLNEMLELEKWMPKLLNDDVMILEEPILDVNEKRHILITHDESVFYANDGKKTFWGPAGHQPLRKKGAGLSLHVSDFLTEIDGRLKFEEEEACVMMKPGINRDGWWKTEDLIKQIIEKAIPIFEKLYPDNIGVFAFDNATSHAAYAEDALIASRMNLKPGGKGKFKDGLMPDGTVQSMHLSNGQPKGIKLVLEERGLWPQNQLKRICDDCKKHSPILDNCCAVRVLSLQPDFLAQKPLIREVIENRGHKVIFYPKFHCELNFIEMFWGAAKRYARNNCDYSFKSLEKIVPEALNSVSLEQIRRYARRSWRFMDAYRKGLTGIAALYAVKQYRSHRRIPENVIDYVNS